MSFNSFGRVFRFSTWGESHGPAIGAVDRSYVCVVVRLRGPDHPTLMSGASSAFMPITL